MDKLNYAVLEQLDQTCFEVTDVDVKRLRDDRSEIQLGDEIAFVAVASFRLTQKGVDQLKKAAAPGQTHVAIGDELLAIGNDAELRSDKLAIDEDSVALWLHDRYDFHFVLDGTRSDGFAPLGQVRIETDSPAVHPDKLDLPWLRKLNTVAIKADYADVDVRIGPRKPDKPPAPAPARMLTRKIAHAEFHEASVELQFALDATGSIRTLDELRGRTFRVPLASADGDAILELTIGEVHTVAAKSPSPGDPARPAHYKP